MGKTHSAVNEPLNPGVTEEEAVTDAVIVAVAEEGVSLVLPQTPKRLS